MPLLACPDCGQNVSDAAPACIHCGRPQPTPPAPQPLQPARDAGSFVSPRDPSELTRIYRSIAAVEQRGRQASPALAALCSLLLPGLGQLLQERAGAAAFYFFGVGVPWLLFAVSNGSEAYGGLWLVACLFVAVAIHLGSVVDAAVWKGEA